MLELAATTRCGLAAMGSGLFAGLLMVRRLGPAEPLADIPSPRRQQDEVEEELAQCMAQLADLRVQQRRLQPAAFAEQTAALTHRASQLLSARQRLSQIQELPVPKSPVLSLLAKRPQLRGALWGGATVGIFAFLMAQLSYWTPAAPAPPPAAPPAASTPASRPTAEIEAEMQGLMRELGDQPKDVVRLARLAHLLIQSRMLKEARSVNNLVLKLDPQNAAGRANAAVLQAAAAP
jgi:hypothetical protein